TSSAVSRNIKMLLALALGYRRRANRRLLGAFFVSAARGGSAHPRQARPGPVSGPARHAGRPGPALLSADSDAAPRGALQQMFGAVCLTPSSAIGLTTSPASRHRPRAAGPA